MAADFSYMEYKGEEPAPSASSTSSRVGLDHGELEELFGSFSTTRDTTGTVEFGRLPFMLRCLGCSDVETNSIFGKVKDHHKFPIITWSEFKKIISQHLPEAAHEWPSHESVKEAFRVFDQEGFSYIHANQLKRFMQSALGDVEDDKLDQLISEACEPDGDGLINYSVFVDYIKEEYEKIQQGGS